MSKTASIFSASEPSLGYIYQIRYGLLLIASQKDDDAKFEKLNTFKFTDHVLQGIISGFG